MMKLALEEILSFFGYSEERNTSLRLKWPRTGPHTVQLPHGRHGISPDNYNIK